MSIPLHLVTGFLGSGKTTFLMHYLDTFSQSRKIAVIQNEFSAAAIDGQIIKRKNGAYKMLEINNGSVFCVCLLGSFIDSLAVFIDDNVPDELVMEASGMSDPVSIVQIFQSEKLKHKVYLGYSWSIVDAKNFERTTAIRSRLEHQIRIADTVIVNKSDLVGDKIDSVITEVKKINPFAKIEKSSFANIELYPKKNPFKIFPSGENRDSYKPNLQSFVIKSSRTISEENLVRFINSIKQNFIRCKGYVNIAKERKLLVQGTFDDYTFEPTEWFAGVTELVGIGHFNETENYTSIFENYCNK